MRFQHAMSITTVFFILAQSTAWAESIRLSVTPTVSPLESHESSKFSGADQPGKTISFRLTMEKKSNVEIDIYNADGKQVGVIKKVMPAGPGTLVWDCASVPPGTFQARVKIDGVEKKTRISLVK